MSTFNCNFIKILARSSLYHTKCYILIPDMPNYLLQPLCCFCSKSFQFPKSFYITFLNVSLPGAISPIIGKIRKNLAQVNIEQDIMYACKRFDIMTMPQFCAVSVFLKGVLQQQVLLQP